MEALRNSRRKFVALLYTEISELDMINNIRMIILIIRNICHGNEASLLKCKRLIETIISLFIEYEDKEITMNCLDIITALGKQIILKELLQGH